VVASVFPQQKYAMRILKEVLDSDSFRITNRVRIQAYEDTERIRIKESLTESFPGLNRSVKQLHNEIDKIAQGLRYNIEIAEEGNSKAILIFTLVTIIFLPLSFVSSVFGMNTSDIRNMTNSQGVFWSIALPVTATVGGLSMLAAYGGPAIQAQLEKLKGYRLRIEPLSFRKRHNNMDEENTGRPYDGMIPREQTARARKLWTSKMKKKRVTKKGTKSANVGNTS
jgi:hypothetical protein